MSSSGPRKLLMIAYEFPPSAGGGVARLTKFAKYLRASGWEPLVLAGEPTPGRPRDDALLGEIEGIEVVRIPSRNITSALSRAGRPAGSVYRRLRGAPAGGAASSNPDSTTPPRGRRQPVTTRMSRWIAVPDEAVLWSRHVQSLASKLCAERTFDAVLASGPPYSALIAGVHVARACGLPVLLDMRDVWRDNIAVEWPTRLHRSRFVELERRTLVAADAVTAATEGIANEAREMGAGRVEAIYNGFDPEQMPAHRPDPSAPLRIVFLGRFSQDVMDPTAFLEGLALARTREPALAGVRLDVIGPDAPWVGALADRLGLSDVVDYLGFRPYPEALEIVSRADVGLMCVADRPGSEQLYPGKLYDYLGIGIPLFFMGPADGGVAGLIREGRSGVVVKYGDVEGVADSLARLARDKVGGRPLAEPDPGVAMRFDRRAQVARVAALLDEISTERREA